MNAHGNQHFGEINLTTNKNKKNILILVTLAHFSHFKLYFIQIIKDDTDILIVKPKNNVLESK